MKTYSPPIAAQRLQQFGRQHHVAILLTFLAAAVEELTSCEGYFAENQNSLLGLSQHIFGALNRAAGLIAVMHHRGRVVTPSGEHIRGSVWVEQEIGIAAFLAQVQNRRLPVLVYIQKGIEREGVRQQLRLKPPFRRAGTNRLP